MESLFDKSNLPLLRRFAAILLTLLSIALMFWPSIVAFSGEYLKDIRETYTTMYEEGSYQYSKSDARAYANAEITLAKGIFNTSFAGMRSILSANGTVQALEDKYMKKNWDDNYLSRKYDSYKKYLKDLDDEEKAERALYSTGAVFVNILFFGMLAAGVAAIVLYFLNGTRVAGIVFAVLAVFADIFFIVVLATYKEIDQPLTAPGVSMFLLPLFAIAACIVYQRTGVKKAARPMPKTEPRFVPAVGNPFADAPRYQAPAAPAAPAGNPFADAPRYTTPAAPAAPAGNPFEDAPRYTTPAAPTGNPFADAPRDPAPAVDQYARTSRPAPRSAFSAPSDQSFADAPNPVQHPMTPPTNPEIPPTTAEEPSSDAPHPADESGWICKNCDTQNRMDSQFCVGCGLQKPEEPINPVCVNCRQPLTPGARFCPYCGAQQ